MRKKISKPGKVIKPLPVNGSYEEFDQYFSKHSLDELEKAGIAKKLSPKEQRWLDDITASVKTKVTARKSRAQLNLAFPEPDLLRFMHYAKNKHIPASTLARAWILDRLNKELGKAG